MNPFQVVKDFEQAVAEYTGAPYCVSISSCTTALLACLVFQREYVIHKMVGTCYDIEIPKYTYIGVAQSILNAEMWLKFRDENWKGEYLLKSGAIEKFEIWDSARRFTSDMFGKSEGIPKYKCLSMHWSKILNPGHGGLIIHNNPNFDKWARKYRFDGRTEGIPGAQDLNPIRGIHAYLLPELASSGLVRLYSLPKDNPDLPNSDYPNLSEMDIFK